MRYDFDEVLDRRHSDSNKWNLFPEDVLPMWVADMDFRSPEPVIRALRERVEHGVFGYGMEPAEIRTVVVERLHQLYGWDVAPEAVLFFPGVVKCFSLVNRAVTRRGDAIFVQTPGYPPILRAAANAHCDRQEMELTQGPDSRYSIDFDVFDCSITDRTCVFLLCNPHNPVGRMWTREELEHMAETCLRHNTLVVSDEIHCDLVYGDRPHIPFGSLSPEVAQHSVTLMAPSKTYNIAGLHSSVAIIPHADLRNKVVSSQRGIVGRPDILAYTAALAAYRDGDEWLAQVRAYLKANRDYAIDYLHTYMPQIRVAKPEGTYLAWLDCRNAGIDGVPREFFLERAKVALNDGAEFGRGGEGFCRLNFGCPRSLLEEGLGRMRRAMESLG